MPNEGKTISQLPWQVSLEELLDQAAGVASGGAFCVFTIDDQIPEAARGGYAALVIAYARADEPVCILPGGAAALLVRDGGTAAGAAVANRVLGQMRRLSLERTLRAGLAVLDQPVEAALQRARAAAVAGATGSVTIDD